MKSLPKREHTLNPEPGLSDASGAIFPVGKFTEHLQGAVVRAVGVDAYARIRGWRHFSWRGFSSVGRLDRKQLLERAMMEASVGSAGAAEAGEDAGVDVKADEFIAKFYAQMKLQRQVSWLKYNDIE